MSEMLHIEDALASEGVYVGTTAGVSMWPMLRNRRDTIVVKVPEGCLQRFDVPLYRRGDAYVLHRIVEVLPDSYVILGDNCLVKERGITDAQIIGVLAGFYRGSKKMDMNSAGYRAYVRIWYALYPLRSVLMRVRGKAARVWHAFVGEQRNNAAQLGGAGAVDFGSSKNEQSAVSSVNPVDLQASEVMDTSAGGGRA